MNILLIFPGFICAFVLILLYEMELRKLRKLSARLKNKTRFYVARDKDETLWLYMGKPRRGIDSFYSCNKGCPMKIADDFAYFGLNPKDFENLRFEDEPVEVFLN